MDSIKDLNNGVSKGKHQHFVRIKVRFDQKYKELTGTILCVEIKVSFDKKYKGLTIIISSIGIKVRFDIKYLSAKCNLSEIK